MAAFRKMARTAVARKDEKHVILDTDPGIDDSATLLFLRAFADVHLHSITTVFGNGPVDLTTRNARYLIDRFAPGTVLFEGADRPLVGERFVPRLKVHGADGLGETGLADNVDAQPEQIPAWCHIVESVRARPGELSLLAIGPLTNLALALRHDPEIALHVREVVVMGGAFGSNGRHGNIRPTAEANFYYDADAADAVLAAGWPVTIVGLDVSTDCVLTTDDARTLAETAPDAGGFLWQISRGYEEVYRHFDGIEGFCLHDVAAAAFLVLPELFETMESRAEVLTSGDDRGNSRFLNHASDGRPTVAICRQVDGRAVIEAFIAAIQRFDVKKGGARLSTESVV